MGDAVKRRRYDATRRRAAAEQRRGAILAAARELFLAHGYRATTMTAVAERAGVAPDTVYTGIGTKPALFRALVESALSGREEAVAGRDRDYAVAMRATPDLAGKLAIYANAVTRIQQRLAPLFAVLREAAASEPELGALWREISRRRARNMRALTADLITSGQVRTDRSPDDLADLIWATNSTEFYTQLVLERAWSNARFAEFLADTWLRILRA